MNTIEVQLPVYDNDGNEVGSTTAILNADQINDIVNQAVRVIYAVRTHDEIPSNDSQEELAVSLGELEEALEAYSVIEEEKYSPAKLF